MSRDPLLFHAIGVFTATFLYAIAALAWVDRGTGKVPFLSVWMVVALLLSSVAVFVGLVHRLNRLHIHRVLNFTGDLGRRVIEMLYPPVEKGGAAPAASEFRRWPITQSLHYSGPPRAIQAMDIRSLAGLAENADGVIEVTSSVGDTLVESTLLLRIYGARRTVGERELRRAIRVGQERTFEQDPKYAIRLLVDIAIRALSPAVNDPSTAVQALDQIEDLLVRLGRRRLENSAGRLRLVIPVPTWEDFLNLAFDEIRFYGATSVQVSRRLRALLLDLVEAVPEERRQPVRNQLTRLEGAIRRAYPDAEDHAQASAEDREGLGAPRTRRTA
jgi:uncharacterized membrane protein